MRLCSSIFLFLLSSVNPEPGPQPGPQPGGGGGQAQSLTGVEQELVTRYLLSRLLDTKEASVDRSDQDSAGSIVYPQVSSQRVSRPLRKLLDQAKDNIDVIDFRSSKHDVSCPLPSLASFCKIQGNSISSRETEIELKRRFGIFCKQKNVFISGAARVLPASGGSRESRSFRERPGLLAIPGRCPHPAIFSFKPSW